MRLKVLTPQRLVMDDEVFSATLPTRGGQITVMDGHDLVVTVLKKGIFYFRKDKESYIGDRLIIDGGCAEIGHHGITVFTGSAKNMEENHEH